MFSSLGKLNWLDLVKTVVLLCLVVIFKFLLVNLAQIHFANDPATNDGIINIVSLILGYLIKNLSTDSQGVPLGSADKN